MADTKDYARGHSSGDWKVGVKVVGLAAVMGYDLGQLWVVWKVDEKVAW